MTETIKVAGEGITVDLLIWRRFRKPQPGLVEQVLALNPGLAGLGPNLPVGTPVILPVIPDATATPVRALVQLWD